MPSRVRMRGRDMPLERMLFVVVLGCSVLLLSVVVLRSEQATGVASTSSRTFRDGFNVAQRRVESSNATMAAVENVLATGGGGGGTKVQVESQGDHTMTKIKTEDGDEITIKRATNSNKITTISAHEDGKITIENREKTRQDSSDPQQLEEGDGHLKAIVKDQDESLRTVGAGGYEKMAPGRETRLADVEKELEESEEQPRLRRIDAAETETSEGEMIIKREPKKVTVVELGRAHTKVNVHDAQEYEQTAPTS